MEYQPRVKFDAVLDVNGDIVPGTAQPGFLTSTLSGDDYGVYFCLLENPANNTWEICRYDATADSGSRRVVLFGSGGYASGLTAPLTGLTCSLVAHPNGYVLNTHVRTADTPAKVRSVDATGIGAMPDIGTACQNSLAINGTVRDDSPRSIAIGGWAGGIETVSIGFEASAESFIESSTEVEVNLQGSVAIGYRAKTTAGGEVALGSANASHMSGIPVMTENPEAGGTFVFKAVAGYDGINYLNILSDLLGGADTYKPFFSASDPQWVFHVQGTVVARATDAANDKVVKVEWVTGGTLTQAVLTQGANNISLGLALDGMRLQATVAAVAGLRLAGYLHVTKVALPQ